jgi:hypothetical protein
MIAAACLHVLARTLRPHGLMAWVPYYFFSPTLLPYHDVDWILLAFY